MSSQGFTLPGLTSAQPSIEKPPHGQTPRELAAVSVRSPARRGGLWRGWRRSEGCPPLRACSGGRLREGRRGQKKINSLHFLIL